MRFKSRVLLFVASRVKWQVGGDIAVALESEGCVFKSMLLPRGLFWVQSKLAFVFRTECPHL